MKVCIIGAGPSGLFLAQRIVKRAPSAKLSIIDARKSPFGLVNYGVAPDHPEVKNCMTSFSELLSRSNVSFFGNVVVGGTLGLSVLQKLYDVVVIATGMGQPRKLGISGEQLHNYATASDFVGWYNNDPNYAHVNFDLSSIRKVAVIGHGNVALDVSRILLKPGASFTNSSISPKALKELERSKVEFVDIIGRRGPLQISFTASELREMLNLPNVGFSTDVEIVNEQLSKHEAIWRTSRVHRRLLELIRSSGSHCRANRNGRTWSIKYFRSPEAIIGTTKVEGLVLERMKPEQTRIETWKELKEQKAVKTGIVEHLPYELVISCIGFANGSTFDLPTFGAFRAIENIHGRIPLVTGLYVCGWAATGPEGELSSTMRNAYAVADSICDDYQDKIVPCTDMTPSPDSELPSLLRAMRVEFTTFSHKPQGNS